MANDLRPDERQRLAAGRLLSFVVQEGQEVRALVYLGLPRDGRGASFRMASLAPDLEEELRERQQVFLGHLASLAALALAAALALLPREGERTAPPEGALHAYEQAMEQLRDQGEEMSARHEAERRRMEEAIREKEALVRAGELTAGIAHEVRNGLGTIVGYARLLERTSLPEDPAAAARAIREECETLETVVRRFTDFVKMERLQLGDTDLARLLARVVAREQRAREEVRTRLVGLDAPLVVRADEELLERAFENVVRNAVEAAAGGGRRVEVSAGRAPGRSRSGSTTTAPASPRTTPARSGPSTRPGPEASGSGYRWPGRSSCSTVAPWSSPGGLQSGSGSSCFFPPPGLNLNRALRRVASDGDGAIGVVGSGASNLLKTIDLLADAPRGTGIASNGGDMANDALVPRRPDRGFSLVEMLIVVLIVAIMAAVAFPNIAGYLRNYKIRGAAQGVAGELQTARSKAIMTNTNAGPGVVGGVSFVVVDADSYRFVQEDMLADVAAGTIAAGSELSRSRTCPWECVSSWRRAPARDRRSGSTASAATDPAAGGACAPTVAAPCAPADALRCNREAGANYFAADDVTMQGGLVLTLLEETTGLRRTVRLAPGGRVLPQP